MVFFIISPQNGKAKTERFLFHHTRKASFFLYKCGIMRHIPKTEKPNGFFGNPEKP